VGVSGLRENVHISRQQFNPLCVCGRTVLSICIQFLPNPFMGLKGGPTGAKAQFQMLFPAAFSVANTLTSARDAIGVSRSRTLAVVDGNVLLMAIPSGATTMNAYVSIVSNSIDQAVQAAAHVVVVFDEPAHLTAAKKDEQAKRDQSRTKPPTVTSDDFSTPCPTSDDYQLHDLLLPETNTKLLMQHRAARARFHDAVCMAVLEAFKTTYQTQEDTWSLTFDGIDCRGGDRPVGAKRSPGIVSSNEALWSQVLGGRETPIGEGDLKLADVPQRVRAYSAEHPTSALARTNLFLLSTIDTDSFLIELMGEAERVEQGCASDTKTLLCLREPSRKRKDEEEVKPAHHLVCSMHSLHRGLIKYLYGTAVLSEGAKRQSRLAVAYVAAAVAMCGCDYLEVRGMRSDYALSCARSIIQREPASLEALRPCVERTGGPCGQAVRMAVSSLIMIREEFIDACAGIGKLNVARRNASVEQPVDYFFRMAWLLSYWSGQEYKQVAAFGFDAIPTV